MDTPVTATPAAVSSSTDGKNVLVVSDNRGRDDSELREKECYMLFLNSRTRRFKTNFGRTVWEPVDSGTTGRTLDVIGKQRERIQKDFLAHKANRFVTINTNRYAD